jgi:citrate lyase subunit beta/citryl-CoA lyase
LANRVFSPSPEQLDRARKLLDAYEEAARAGEAVIVFDGQMVDEPMARSARALLEES